MCAGYFLTSLADSLFVCYITHGFIAGLFSCFAWQPCVVIIPQYFVKKRSTSTGIAVAGSGVGTFAMAPLTSFLFNELGAVKRIFCVSFSVKHKHLPRKAQDRGQKSSGKRCSHRLARRHARAGSHGVGLLPHHRTGFQTGQKPVVLSRLCTKTILLPKTGSGQT